MCNKDIVDKIANEVIKTLDENDIKKLKEKPPYDHFGFGLYIRNNFIYNNADTEDYPASADDLSAEIYERILKILSQ